MHPNVSVSSRGLEKFAFLYVLLATVAVAGAVTFSWIAGLVWWQTLLVLVGALIGAWGTTFSFLETRRVAQRPDQRNNEILREDTDPYIPRKVKVAPPTGDPYPHHEDYPESAGFDQGQLTSRLPDETPFVEEFLKRRSEKK